VVCGKLSTTYARLQGDGSLAKCRAAQRWKKVI
jgi:hypothetical protein